MIDPIIERARQRLLDPEEGENLDRLYRQFREEGLPRSVALLNAFVEDETISPYARKDAAKALKDHEVPKLSASTLVTYDGDFAKRLDLAIERANGHKLLDHAKVIEHAGSQQHPASEIAKPLPPRLGVPLRRRA